jgi:hypothetical protein
MAKENDSNELQIYCNYGPSLTKKTKPEREFTVALDLHSYTTQNLNMEDTLIYAY